MRTAKTASLLTSVGAVFGLCTVIAAGPVGVAAADSTEHSTNTAEPEQSAAGSARSGGSALGGVRRPMTGSTPPATAPVGSRSPVGRRVAPVSDSGPAPIDRRARLLDDSPPVPAAAGRTQVAPKHPASTPEPEPPAPAPETPALGLTPARSANAILALPAAASPTVRPVAAVAVTPGRIALRAEVPSAVEAPEVAPAAVMRAAPTNDLSIPKPLVGNGNGLPALAPVAWVMAAAVRREWGGPSAATAVPPAALLTTAAVLPAALLTTAAVLPAAVNRVPVISSVVVGRGDPATGVVTAVITARDPDNDRITFRTSSTTRGRATITAGGVLTYTPTSAARHAAAMEQAAPQALNDTVTVTVADTKGAQASTAVTVPIVPRNAVPVAQTSVGTPNASTGVVTGRVGATDSDRDVLTLTAPTSTAKGAVRLGISGDFTYTPSSAARHAAARTGAGTAVQTDTFTVTVRDGYGGVVNVPVTVSIASRNTAPVASAPTVGAPDSVTGVVTGSVRATDADGDPLTYSAPATTPKGNLTVSPGSGAFRYTPTPAARNAAAAPGATDADRRDGFTVTVTDGYGGSTPLAVSVPISPKASTPGVLPAFPGAEGFGASATGGRGGSVVYVTNLNAGGPGSLQWAIDQPGAKYVLFKVSGVIDSQIHLTNGDVTIAGQTSPGGITVRGFVTDETPYQDQDVRAPSDFAENWILQHIRIRPGADGPSDDGLRLRYTRNAIVDHVSIGNATDEAIEISYSNNVTVQNTLLAETLGSHAEYGGILMNYSNPAYGFGLDNVSLHHNVFNRIWGRLPEGSRESLAAANSTMNLEMSNNLYWDPRFFVALGQNTGVVTNTAGDPYPIYWKINAVNNYFRTGTSFPYGMFDDQIMRVPANQLFVSGNKMSLYPTRSDYELFFCCNDYATLNSADIASLVAEQQAQKRTTRHPFPAITYTPTDQLRTILLATAGAWPRDPMDTRLMQSVAANTIATASIETNPAGDALRPSYTGTAPAAPADADNDGMPDSWEAAKGLNPAVANSNATTLSTLGYTDLEVYLHELSARRIGATAL